MKKISSKVKVIIILVAILCSGIGIFGAHAAEAFSVRGFALQIIGFPIQLIIVPVLGMLVRIAGFLLDKSIMFTLDTSVFGGGIATAITLTWAIVRNIFNITFIFVLLYTAIKTILGLSDANTKKTISHVIFAALLINFSLFATRLLIDAGNMIAIAFYNTIVADSSASMGIGAILLDKIGMSDLFQYKQLAAQTGGVFEPPFFIASCLQVMLLLTLFVTFMYAALLMITRSVALIFLMIMSPMGFLFDIVPMFKEYSGEWWKNLRGQILIAPVFLLFIYLITLIGKGLTAVASVVNIASIKSAVLGVVAKIAYAQGTAAETVDLTVDDKIYMVYFKFILITVLIVMAVKASKTLSGAVGDAVGKLGAAAAGIAIGAATGGAALLARQTIGRGAAKLATNENYANRAKEGGLDGFAARMVLRTANKTSKASFDVRNTSAFKSASGLLDERSGVKFDFNKGAAVQKDGYQGAMKRRAEREEETAKLIDRADVSVSLKDKFILRSELDNERRKAIAEKEAEKNSLGMLETQEKKDKHTQLEKQIAELNSQVGSDSDQEITKQITETKKAARLSIFADQIESSKLNILFRNKKESKEAADKIRKVGKPKDGKTLAAEAAKKLAEEEALKNPSPTASPTPAPAKPAAPTPKK